MVFAETKPGGVYIIDQKPPEDERGFFAHTFCPHEFAVHDLDHRAAQFSTSFNKKKGPVRGLHYQLAP